MKRVSVPSLFVISAIAVGATAMAQEDFECYTKASEGEQVCMVTPSDAQVASPLKLRHEGPTVSMLSARDLSGEATEPEDLNGLDLDEEFVTGETVPSRSIGMEAAAISQSVKTQDQLRWIETFLKTGPSASSPDIRPGTISKPSK